MTTEMRKTGVEIVGDMPWGTHFCLFYETTTDLLETLVSYCKAGLEGQEFCLWVVAEPLSVEEATRALKQAVPDLDRYFSDHSIEIVAARDWYLQDGKFDLNRVIGGWNEKLARASARGYAGVRVTGDTAWLEKKDWKDFCEYEDSLNQAVANQRLAVLCTYPLAACGASEILDVVRTHQFAVTKRRGGWDVIETAGHKQAKAEIKRLNAELEQRVTERTRQLTSVNSELTKEIIQRKRAENALLRSEAYLAEAQTVSHTGSFGWNLSSGDIVWSDETLRIFDFDPAKRPTLAAIVQRTHPEDRARVQETIDHIVRKREAFDLEHRLLMPNGAVKHIHVVGHPSTRDESEELEFVGAVTDITQRKRAEEALRASEAQLRQIIDSIPGMVFALSPTGQIELFNRRLLDYFGKTLDELNDWRANDAVHPEDLPRMIADFTYSMTNGVPIDIELRYRRADGVYRWFQARALPVRDADGRIARWYCLITDIEDRKQAEEALRQSEGYLAEAQRISHTGSGAWRVAEGDALYLSDEWYRIYGFDPKHGLSAWKERLPRMHPEDRAKVAEAKDRAIREKSDYELEHRILLPDGTLKYTHNVGHPVLNASGQVVQFVCTMMDITERKRAEALREGESRILEMIARDAPLEGILEKLVRVVEAQFAGLLCSVLLLEDGQHVRHGAAPNLPAAYIEAINGLPIGPKAGSCGTAMYRREPVVVADILEDPLWEQYRDVAKLYGFRACWSTPILAHSGKALGSFAMYYREPGSPGAAESHALEMATHLAGIAIERKLAREERERLRQAEADLAHMNRVATMGELTASLAHEIKQPITAAITDARTCLRWLSRDIPNVSEGRDAASRVVTGVTRAAEIISRISLLFKKGALQEELVDINELIQEMIVLLRSEASRYSISIHGELANDLPQMTADRVQLQQVLMNLMLNGIEAMKDVGTGGELTIKSQQDENRHLLISVSDTGVGLKPEQAEQIFDAFFTTKPQGTGMGLPISRSIVESHGGRLWATSNSGPGATFHFTLHDKVTTHKAA